ncbi:MAG: XRE family transcriptional regulator [Clostridiales Family XIII bacterium]|jgi:hypothetical protein|nr:XRE family transcriptional regulator [Clostridiales Family XIII bacterium]
MAGLTRYQYELRLYDEKLLTFEFAGDPPGGAKVLSVECGRRELFPLDFVIEDGELPHEGLGRWLRKRTIPKNRAYVHNILNSLGLSVRDTKGIIDICKGLSLNDSYWVVPAGFDGKFDDYNLFENRFSEALALTALTGESLSADKARRIRTSPEFTTDGMLPKAWRHDSGKIMLFKGGVWRQYAQTPDPLEPFSEFYAAQIAGVMGLNPVKYGLSRWKGILGSTCELFTDIDTAYVPAATAARSYYKAESSPDYYLACEKWYKDFDCKNGTNLYDYFASTLVFDSLILNEDRHLGNFGVLRDNHSGKIIGNAPVFDNGMNLFNYSSIQELRKIDPHRRAYANYFKDSFDAQAKHFGSNLQIEQLAKLADFKFRRHSRYNWEPERLEIISEYIRNRASELIGMMTG